MTTCDARKMSRQELLALRQEVVRLHKVNTPIMKIVEMTGLSWPAVHVAITKDKGSEALQPQKRGRKIGTERFLSIEQEKLIRDRMYRSRPNWQKPMIMRDGHKSYLWTRDAIAELISREWKLELTRRGLDNYLVRWGLPCFPKGEHPLDRCTPHVQNKLKENVFVKQAAQDGRQIVWVTTRKLSVSEEEQNTIHRKFMLTMATDNRGKSYWLCGKGPYSDEQQIVFLKALWKHMQSPLAVIRDNQRYYTEAPVQRWLAENSSRVLILPPPPASRH